MAGADVLVLLSDVDGLYTANPRIDPAARAARTWSRRSPRRSRRWPGGTGSALSRGGMKTKLIAARAAMRAGCAMAITEGAVDRPLTALADGAPCTWFEPDGDPQAARKRWISGMKPRGRVTVDAGAVAALGARQVAAARRRHRRSRAASCAATRSRSSGRTARWSPRRWRATMPARRDSSWATARTGSPSCSAIPAGPRSSTATTWRSEGGGAGRDDGRKARRQGADAGIGEKAARPPPPSSPSRRRRRRTRRSSRPPTRSGPTARRSSPPTPPTWTGAAAKGLGGAMLDRLLLTEARVAGMVDGLRAIAAQPDPVGQVHRRMGPALGPAHPPGPHADRGDRGDLREPAERHRRRRRALPQGRQRGDPARRLGEPALVAGDPRRPRRRASRPRACRRPRSSWCRPPTARRSARC